MAAMETQKRPVHQYVLLAVIAAVAILLIPGTDVSWSAGLVAAL